jgi:hypothetical protein
MRNTLVLHSPTNADSVVAYGRVNEKCPMRRLNQSEVTAFFDVHSRQWPHTFEEVREHLSKQQVIQWTVRAATFLLAFALLFGAQLYLGAFALPLVLFLGLTAGTAAIVALAVVRFVHPVDVSSFQTLSMEHLTALRDEFDNGSEFEHQLARIRAVRRPVIGDLDALRRWAATRSREERRANWRALVGAAANR